MSTSDLPELLIRKKYYEDRKLQQKHMLWFLYALQGSLTVILAYNVVASVLTHHPWQLLLAMVNFVCICINIHTIRKTDYLYKQWSMALIIINLAIEKSTGDKVA